MEQTYFLQLPFTISAAWIIAFFINRRYIRLHDRVLLMLLGCCSLTCYIVMRSLSEATGDYLYILFDNIETVLGLSACPLLFMYMRIVARDSHWHRWYYLLFAPGILIGVAGTALSKAVGWDRIVEIRKDNFVPFSPNPDSHIENLYKLVNITLFNFILEIMAIVLVGWSIFYLMRYYKRIGNYYADIEDSSVGRMRNFLISAILLLMTIFAITAFINDILGKGNGILIAISTWLSILLWSICYNTYNIKLTNRNIDIVNEEEVLDETVIAMPEDVIGEKILKWKSDKQKPFCREGILIHDVAREMNVNPRELSVYINNHYGVNFNRWINTLRIEEAKRLLSESDDAKISYISAICGFSEPSSLSKAFRMIEGCSPKEFKAKENISNKE